jgi:CRP/FNR family cyclic AMP-dependent transcriptional regulator
MDQAITLENILSFLLDTHLFEALDPIELSEVVKVMQIQRLRDGQPVFEEGDDGDAWYVIYEGEIEVFKADSYGRARLIATLEPHACFGEMAVLDSSSRSATVRSGGESTLFRFPSKPFQNLIDEGSLAAYKLIYGMARVLCQRQRTVNQQYSEATSEEPGEKSAIRRRLDTLLDSYTISE